MSEQNVETVRLSNEAFNRRDIEGVMADFDPDVEWEDLSSPLDVPSRARGTRAIREVLARWNQSFEELTADVEEFIDAGDAVVCVTHWHARGTGSGVPVDQTSAEVYEFEDGQIVRATLGYPSRADALQALGG